MKKYNFNIRNSLPKIIDNEFKGIKVALYMFYILTAITIVRSVIHILAPDGGAQSIATIPLNSYSEEAKNTVIYMFGTWGLSQLLMGIMYLIVSIRYKSLIPLMYIFICCEYIGRLFIGQMKPIILIGTAPGIIGNYILVPLSIILFVLSITRYKK